MTNDDDGLPLAQVAPATPTKHNPVSDPGEAPPKNNMVSPEVYGVPETEFLEACEHVVTVLCGTFAFGYYSVDDIRQEIRVFCLEAMPRYDRERLLKNFLYVHAYKRLINLQRNKLQRNDPPCAICHAGETTCQKNAEEVCDRYMGWLKRNASKKSLAQPGTYSEAVASKHADPSIPKSPLDNMVNQEIWDIIDQHIPMSLRKDFLRMKEGVSLHKSRRQEVLTAIRQILSKKYPELKALTDE